MHDRRAAYHEAGHALAYIRHAGGFHSAHVLPRGQTRMTDRRGREVVCSGLVQGGSFNWDVAGFPRAKLESQGIKGFETAAHAYMVIDLAGPFAEARYSRVSQLAILLSAGSGDWDSANRIARWLWPDDGDRQSAAFNAAEHEARKLVRKQWESIVYIARALEARGVVTMDDLPPSMLGARTEAAK